MRASSPASRSTNASDAAVDAYSPTHGEASKPGTPASLIVGTSGSDRQARAAGDRQRTHPAGADERDDGVVEPEIGSTLFEIVRHRRAAVRAATCASSRFARRANIAPATCDTVPSPVVP